MGKSDHHHLSENNVTITLE